MKTISAKRAVRIGLVAALTAIGAFLVIPTQPIPFTMQPFFVFLAGIVLGPLDGALSQLVYLAVGGIGIPVFAGMKGGIGHLIGPTGGFLVGFVLCAALAGLIAGTSPKLSFWRGAISIFAGMITMYFCGVFWLAQVTGMNISAAISVGAVPYLLPDAVKALVAAFIGIKLRRQFFQ